MYEEVVVCVCVFVRVCSRREGFAITVCRVRYNGGMPLYRDAFVPSDFGTAIISGTPLFRMPLYRATHCTSIKSQAYTVQNHPFFVKTIISSILLLCCEPVSPDLCLYTCKEFSVHDTISSVVFQNIIITAVLEILELRVSSKLFTGIMVEKENICIPDGIKNAGLSLQYYVGV